MGMVTSRTWKPAASAACRVYPTLATSGRYVAENEHGDGIAKAVVEQGGNRLLGIHLIGTPASEIITAASVALGKEISVNGLKSVVFPHPTVGEILRELLFAL